MPKIILSISMNDIDPILKGIERYKLGLSNCPWDDYSKEGKLFWEGFDAARYQDPISIQDEWNKEIEIFNCHDIIQENLNN